MSASTRSVEAEEGKLDLANHRAQYTMNCYTQYIL